MKRRMGRGLHLLAIGLAVTLATAGLALAEYEVIEVKDGGTVKGTATWKGDLPKMPPLKVFADMDFCGEMIETDVLQIDPASKGVKNVLVYLENIDKGKAPAEKYLLRMGQSEEQPGTRKCLFDDHMFAFVRTAEVAIVNFDNILHNPHFFDHKNASLFNVAMPTPNREVEKKILRAKGVGIHFQCDVHVHMNAWMASLEHPYFAVTDAQGRFEIKDIPPGTYKVVAWHEGYDITKFVSSRPSYDEPHVIKKDVTVQAGQAAETNFEFPVRQVDVQYKIPGEQEEGS